MKRLFAFSCAEAMPDVEGVTGMTAERDGTQNWFRVIPDLETAYRYAGQEFRFMLIDPLIPEDVQAYLRSLNRWHEPKLDANPRPGEVYWVDELYSPRWAGSGISKPVFDEIMARLKDLESWVSELKSRIIV